MRRRGNRAVRGISWGCFKWSNPNHLIASNSARAEPVEALFLSWWVSHCGAKKSAVLRQAQHERVRVKGSGPTPPTAQSAPALQA